MLSAFSYTMANARLLRVEPHVRFGEWRFPAFDRRRNSARSTRLTPDNVSANSGDATLSHTLTTGRGQDRTRDSVRSAGV